MSSHLNIDAVECTPDPINTSGGEAPIVTVVVTNQGDEPTTANITASVSNPSGTQIASGSSSDPVDPGQTSTLFSTSRRPTSARRDRDSSPSAC